MDFSELGPFIDYPVKHYSSGMYVRLGFAVAVHVDPDILIVDEVLAVGDAAFQRKCLARIEDFQRQGKTILFVSHAAGQIESLCTRAVLLDHGRVLFDGPPRQTIKRLNKLLGSTESPPSTASWPGSSTSPSSIRALVRPGGVRRRRPRHRLVPGRGVETAIRQGQVLAPRQRARPARCRGPCDAPIPHRAGRGLPVGTHALSWQIEEWPDMPGTSRWGWASSSTTPSHGRRARWPSDQRGSVRCIPGEVRLDDGEAVRETAPENLT